MLKTLLTFLLALNAFGLELTFKEELAQKYKSANYLEIIDLTNKIDKSLNRDGYISYKRGSSLLELNLFIEAKRFLLDAVKKNNLEKDIFYKLGQIYFALEKYKKSRIYFKKSIQRRYEVAVSLYYIGFSSSKLKDYKTAVKIYNTIEKLPLEQKKDVIQAARLQIADIYYNQVKQKAGIFSSMRDYVIPQYEKALDWDRESILANDIRQKIREIEQRYEIVLYRMRNGRPTAIPRYFLKGGFNLGYADNVNFLSDAQKESLESEKVSSPFVGTSLFARYSLYPNSRFSASPELGLDYRKYINSNSEISANDEVSLNFGTFFTFEHFLFDEASTTSLRINYNLRTLDSENDSSFSDQENYFTATLSEEFQYFKNNPTVLRFSHTTLKSEIDSKNSSTNSLILEQLVNFKSFSYYLFTSYDLIRYTSNDSFDSNNITIRNDFLFYSFLDFINLGPYFSYRMSDNFNSSKGNTSILTFGVNINRPIAKKVYLNLDVLTESQSNDPSTDYTNNRLFMSVDYIY